MLVKDLAEKANVKFGTSGVRGLVDDLSPEVCYAYTAAFISLYSSAKFIAIGHDLRPSSPMIARACIAAAKAFGVEVEYLGALPTPTIAHFCIHKEMPGLVVTGSHIPFDRNGIKFYRADGEISKNDEESISNSIVELPEDINLEGHLPVTNKGGLEFYLDRYVGFFGASFLLGKTIAIYEHSSVARDVLHRVFRSLGASTISLGRSDVFVPIDTEAVRDEDIKMGIEWSKEYPFDMLVSTDGDADRPLIAGEDGIWLRGDVVGVLTSKYLKMTHVVTPVSSNTALERSGFFNSVTRTKIGSPFVIDAMNELSKDQSSKVCGYEANGGFLLQSNLEQNNKVLSALPTRDAILPMLAIMGMSIESQMPISKLPDELPTRFTHSDRIQDFSHEKSQDLLTHRLVDDESIISILLPSAKSVVDKNLVDGLRVTFETGDILHIRPSGNAPELRCYSESSSITRAKELCDEALGRIARFCQ